MLAVNWPLLVSHLAGYLCYFLIRFFNAQQLFPTYQTYLSLFLNSLETPRRQRHASCIISLRLPEWPPPRRMTLWIAGVDST